MSEAAMLERHRTLIRFEHAAGAAFGHEDEAGAARPARFPTALALATLATAVVATLTYLV